MSEVRQRRGGSGAEDAAVDDKGGSDPPSAAVMEEEIARLRAQLAAVKQENASSSKPKKEEETEQEEKQRMAEEIAKALEKSVPKPVKGMSNTAKECKQRLDSDPFNMQYIFDLGLAYGQDQQWDRCANVLMRGWKRIGEFDNATTRYAFLACLTEASLKTSKFRQALAVLNDIEDPVDEEQLIHYQELRCQVFCENGDLQKALQAWNKTIEGRGFEDILAVWARCLKALKKVGALEVTRGALAELGGEENQQQIEAVEKLVTLREEMFFNKTQDQPNPTTKKFVYGLAAVSLVFLMFILHHLESKSLSRLTA